MSTYLDRDAAAIRSALEPGVTPPPDSEYLFVLYAVLLRAKGLDVTVSDVHNAWVAWMQLSSPGHKSIRPFEELNREVQEEDEPYVKAIRIVAQTRSETRRGLLEQ